MRLGKYLAHAGVASRRGSERLIGDGRVRVGGVVVRDPAHDVTGSVEVSVDGQPLVPEPREAWILNKPAGVVSTASDPQGRPTVTELVVSSRRLYPVGRLDYESTGLLLLTNDGELANRLTHPRFGVPKTYRARLARRIDDRALSLLRGGVKLDDGYTAPAKVKRCSPRVIELTVREGRNRQIRRMIEAVGNEVTGLTRIRLGPLSLGELREGAARQLGPTEMSQLWEYARDD